MTKEEMDKLIQEEFEELIKDPVLLKLIEEEKERRKKE